MLTLLKEETERFSENSNDYAGLVCPSRVINH